MWMKYLRPESVNEYIISKIYVKTKYNQTKIIHLVKYRYKNRSVFKKKKILLTSKT